MDKPLRTALECTMNPREDLVERLRETADVADVNYPEQFGVDTDDVRAAADEIERLRAKIARYKRALDKIAAHDLQFVALSALKDD